MTWNYRIIEHKNTDGSSWFAIHEVYYDEAGTPEHCSEEPCFAHGEDVETLITDMQYMTQALNKPVLRYSDFDKKEQRPDV
jgi:hypothetical protein